jgi:metallo-beta-lactamase family protein
MYEYYDDDALDLLRAGINPVAFPDLRLSVSSDESKAINADMTPKVILSASGMCEAGRIRHHLKHNLWRPECTVMFVGYQSQGTVGSKILDGVDSVKLFGEEISVKAEIVRIESFSSHADKDHLREWVKKAEPSARIFINHGEDEVTDKFAAEAEAATGKPAVAPYSGEVWDLAECRLVHKAEVVPVISKQARTIPVNAPVHRYKVTRVTERADSVYNDLRKSGEDLMDLINSAQGSSNKDLKALTAEIAELISKYKK